MSAFMQPEITREAFLVVENTSGESFAFPADVALDALTLGRLCRLLDAGVSFDGEEPTLLDCVRDYIEGEPARVELIRDKFWARLSAPGYLDATEWDGPHETMESAKGTLSDAYDICPECGEDINEDGECDDCEETTS